MNEIIKITFFFANGTEVYLRLRKEEYDDLVSKLKNNWDNIIYTTEDYGLRFSHISHYILHKNIEKKEETPDEDYGSFQTYDNQTAVKPDPSGFGDYYKRAS
jgi:hypothetical protein